MRFVFVLALIGSIFVALPESAEAQKVKLRDSGIKGYLAAKGCGSDIDSSPCTVVVGVPPGAESATTFYVTQVCAKNEAGGSNVIQLSDGVFDGGRINTSFRFGSAGGSDCQTFNPAVPLGPGITYECSGTGNGRCTVIGVFGK